MTAKELRRLSKTDLLTMLRDQEAELELLRAEKTELEQKLEDRTLRLSECGSIADAAMEVNDVFKAAQAAADQYLSSVRSAQATVERRTHAMEAEAKQRAEDITQQAEALCRQKLAETQRQVDAYWGSLAEKLEDFYQTHVGLQQMLSGSGINLQLPIQSGREQAL